MNEHTRGRCFVGFELSVELGELVAIHFVFSEARDEAPQLAFRLPLPAGGALDVVPHSTL